MSDADNSGTESDDSGVMEFTAAAATEDGVVDDEDEDDEDNQVVIDFVFCDPSPVDFKSVRRLLERYLPGQEATFNASAMAEELIGQTQLGTTLKVQEDLDAYGIVTIVPFDSTADWVKQVRSYLLRHCKDAGQRASLAALLESGRIGLLVNERVVNVPPELCPSLHESLVADVKWAKLHASPAFREKLSVLDSLLMVSPCFAERAQAGGVSSDVPSAAAAPPYTKRRVAQAAAAAHASGKYDTSKSIVDVGPGWTAHFLHFEEEIYASQSTLAFTFPVAATGDKLAGGVASEPVDPTGNATSRPTVSAGEGKKRRRERGQAATSAGSATDDTDTSPAATAFGPRPPQFRHVSVFPIGALDVCVSGMHRLLAAAAAAVGVSVPAGTLASPASGSSCTAAPAASAAPHTAMVRAGTRSDSAGPGRRGSRAEALTPTPTP